MRGSCPNITYAYFSNKKGENKNLLIDNTGKILIDYSKRYLLGFGDIGETSVFKKGAEIIQAASTPYGIIGISTCRDMSFPPYIRQAGRKSVDIMFSPSSDFPTSKGHSYDLRAIENGFSFVRPTYNGISYAEDYNGKILAQMNSNQSTDGIMYADIPVEGIETFYAFWGDILGWLCIIVASIFLLMAIGRKFYKKQPAV